MGPAVSDVPTGRTMQRISVDGGDSDSPGSFKYRLGCMPNRISIASEAATFCILSHHNSGPRFVLVVDPPVENYMLRCPRSDLLRPKSRDLFPIRTSEPITEVTEDGSEVVERNAVRGPNASGSAQAIATVQVTLTSALPIELQISCISLNFATGTLSRCRIGTAP